MVGPFTTHSAPFVMPIDFVEVGIPLLVIVSDNWTFALSWAFELFLHAYPKVLRHRAS